MRKGVNRRGGVYDSKAEAGHYSTLLLAFLLVLSALSAQTTGAPKAPQLNSVKASVSDPASSRQHPIAAGLEENAKSKDRPVQGRTDRESPAIHSVAFAKMHAAVPHRNPEMTSKLPLGSARCGHVNV